MEKINLRLELLSSLSHTEETSSNIANIYRETILKDGKKIRVPALHGNSFRGLLRNLGGEHLLNSVGVGLETVPMKFFHILFSGGSLTSSVTGIDIVSRRNIRKMFPILSILGSALGNEMLQGKLSVSSGLPECKELGNGDISFNDMVHIVRYTRVDDEKLKYGDKWATVKEEGKDSKDAPTQMFYDIEVLNAGAVLNISLWLDGFTELERSCLFTLLEELKNKPFIGGVSRAGHGEVKILNDIDFEKETKEYKEFLELNKENIKQWIYYYK